MLDTLFARFGWYRRRRAGTWYFVQDNLFGFTFWTRFVVDYQEKILHVETHHA